MAVEDHIDAKEENHRQQGPPQQAGELVRPPEGAQMPSGAVQQQNGAGGRGKEHRRLPEGVEGPVVQNHSGDRVHRPGLLRPPLQVSLRHLIEGGGGRVAEGGQLQGHHQKDRRQHQRHRRAENPVQLDLLFQPAGAVSEGLLPRQIRRDRVRAVGRRGGVRDQPLGPPFLPAHEAVGPEVHLPVGVHVLQILLKLLPGRVLGPLGAVGLLPAGPAEKALIQALSGGISLHPAPSPSIR